MDRGAWNATAHGVAKSRTWLSNFHFINQCPTGPLWPWYSSLTTIFLFPSEKEKKKEQKIAEILSGNYGRERCHGLNRVPPNSYVDCILSDLRIWPYLETGPLKTSPWKRRLRLNEVRWGPYSNLIGVLVRREHLDRKETAETHRQRKDHVRTQWGGSHLQAKKRSLRRNQTRWLLDLGLPASRMW